jgi:bifunctional non-homologous end joining protein LigD
MTLGDYRRKRDFRRTTEPKGRAAKRSGLGRFVVQKHAARRLHYDFRLEMDGVLKSWAVPKGPSLDPSVKALAVEVEDHPLEYATFEGMIPKGEYGGGTVMVWDSGRWEPIGDAQQGYRAGNLKVRLHGEKLKGEWVLVRMRGKTADDTRNWLLIKHRDEFARPSQSTLEGDGDARSVLSGRTMEEIAAAGDAVWHSGRRHGGTKTAATKRLAARDSALGRAASSAAKAIGSPESIAPASLAGSRKAPQPKFVEPQLATLVKAVPQGSQWLHELKFDGYRLLCVKNGDEVRLWTRNRNDWTKRFPTIVQGVRALAVERAILDGEVVVVGSDGHIDFQALQNLMRNRRTDDVTYYAFDLPHAGGYDLTQAPLVERKRLLEQILAERGGGEGGNRALRYSDHVLGHGRTMLEHARRMTIEGIVSKRVDSHYESGRRSTSWLKIKFLKRQELVVGGYTPPSGSRVGFGALLVGYYDEQKGLVYCGRVGTGFNAQSLREIKASLKAREVSISPFDVGPQKFEARGVRWVRPELVAEVEYGGWTDDDRLRHPSFQGLREDKDPKTIGRERAQPTSGMEKKTARSTARRKAGPTVRSHGNPSRASHSADVAGVRISNADRVVYPGDGLTKLDVAEYYEAVAEWIMPGLVDRLLTIVRCPQGLASKCFFQKQVRQTLPPPVRGVEVEESDGVARYVAIDDLPGLITLVQFGALEIHPWGSRVDKLEQPDRLVFDLDPAPEVGWEAVMAAARRVRETLGGLGIESFVRTTGGKGLHVVAPLVRRADWPLAKRFAKAVADGLVARWPEEYIAVASKAQRRSKIFVDYVRNSRGATAIASYSTRALPGATIATPIDWDELTPRLEPQKFQVHSVVRRLQLLKRDPWHGFDALRQSVTPSAVEKAERAARE